MGRGPAGAWGVVSGRTGVVRRALAAPESRGWGNRTGGTLMSRVGFRLVSVVSVLLVVATAFGGATPGPAQ